MQHGTIKRSGKVLFFAAVILFGAGCRSLFKKELSPESKDRTLKASFSGKKMFPPFSALVYLKEDRARMDILRPFSGTFGSLYLFDDNRAVFFPSQNKIFARHSPFGEKAGRFQVKGLSNQLLISVLRGEFTKKLCSNPTADTGASGLCEVKSETTAGGAEVFIKKRKNRLVAFLKLKDGKEIKIRVKEISRKPLPESVFDIKKLKRKFKSTETGIRIVEFPFFGPAR